MTDQFRSNPPLFSKWPLTVALALFTVIAGSAHAFEKLTEAQSWIYERPHMANTITGQVIKYRYYSTESGDETGPVDDVASVTVVNALEDDKRDVVVDFLSDDRRMPLPDFNGYRGNPVIIAMLEHIAQTIGRETDGGALYFRNRIRDALASEDTSVLEKPVQLDDLQISATVVAFSPFVSDPYLKAHPDYLNASFELIFSDEVPGGVISVTMESTRDNETLFHRELLIIQ